VSVQATTFDAPSVLRAALYAARRLGNKVGLDDASVEDLAQEVALRVWTKRLEGHGTDRRGYARFARDGLRALFGDERCATGLSVGRFVPAGDMGGDVDPRASLPGDVRALCVAWLQAVYPTLTPLQQAAVSARLLGTTNVDLARSLGANVNSVCTAYKVAMKRCVDPSAYSRVASRHAFRRTTGGRYLEQEAA
jgi:hypothetical protein